MSKLNKDRMALKFADFREVDSAAPEGRKFADVQFAFRNGGTMRDGSRLDMKDALAMWEAPLFIPKIVNNTIQEAIEPLLIATKMLTRIPFQIGMSADLPVFGAVDGDFDVGEEESYPELRVTYGPGSAIGKIGKQGVQVRFTEEVLRYSSYDVVGMGLSQAARAMARNKEEKIFNMWLKVATTTHDNATPVNSQYGTTTGRDITGAQNGTLTLDDIFEMYAAVMHNGWIPNMMIVHPLTWLMFVQDAQLRHFAQMSNSSWFGSQWSGNPAVRDFPSYQGGEGVSGSYHKAHPSNGAAKEGDGTNVPKSPMDFSQNMDSAPVIPGYFGVPMRVIVSPFVPYNSTNNTTSIFMADSNMLGFYIEDMAPQTSEWLNPETDILRIRIKERYTLRERDRGLGLAVAKNVVVGSNQIILPAQASIDVAGSIGTLARRTAV